MAKRRIRTLIRQGWTEVQVPRKNLYKYDGNLAPYQQTHEWGDVAYMNDLIAWCQERIVSTDYIYAMPPSTPYCRQYDNCFKRFVFRNEADAMVFSLRWAE